jgi:hypothetical protein
MGRKYCLLLGPLLAIGCVQTRITEPKRSAVEQLLLSTAADGAVAQANLAFVKGRKIYVEEKYFGANDEEYALGAVRDALSSNGALLVVDRKDAELIIEPRSGALSTDSTTSIIGIPSTPLPIPFSGTLQTPEMSLFKSQKQYSVAKIALLAYERESGKHVNSSGALDGFAHHHYYTILSYFKYTSTSIPEKKRHAKKHAEERARENAAAQEPKP